MRERCIVGILRKSESCVGYSSLLKARCKHTEFKLGEVNYNSTVDNLSNLSQPSHSLFHYLPRCKSSYNIHYLMVSASIRINLIIFMDLTLDAFPFSSDSHRILWNASILFNYLFAPNSLKSLSTLRTDYCTCHGIRWFSCVPHNILSDHPNNTWWTQYFKVQIIYFLHSPVAYFY
jgi:hypothetical protein